MAKRNRIGGRTIVRFDVSSKDVAVELNKLAKEMALSVKNGIEATGTIKKITKNMESRLTAIHNPSKPRIRKVLDAINVNNKASKEATDRIQKFMHGVRTKQPQYPERLRGNYRALNATMNIGHIESLDKKTLIANLDAEKTPRHIGPFAPGLKSNTEKAIGAESSYKYHLWRILQERQKFFYPISARNARQISYTTAKDNYQFWHGSKTVMWKAGSIASRNTYFMLTKLRQMYVADTNYFITSVFRSVKEHIEKRSRFRK